MAPVGLFGIPASRVVVSSFFFFSFLFFFWFLFILSALIIFFSLHFFLSFIHLTLFIRYQQFVARRLLVFFTCRGGGRTTELSRKNNKKPYSTQLCITVLSFHSEQTIGRVYYAALSISLFLHCLFFLPPSIPHPSITKQISRTSSQQQIVVGVVVQFPIHPMKPSDRSLSHTDTHRRIDDGPVHTLFCFHVGMLPLPCVCVPSAGASSSSFLFGLPIVFINHLSTPLSTPPQLDTHTRYIRRKRLHT